MGSDRMSTSQRANPAAAKIVCEKYGVIVKLPGQNRSNRVAKCDHSFLFATDLGQAARSAGVVRNTSASGGVGRTRGPVRLGSAGRSRASVLIDWTSAAPFFVERGLYQVRNRSASLVGAGDGNRTRTLSLGS